MRDSEPIKNSGQPYPPNDKRHIFTEGIDYGKTGGESIWGSEDDVTVKAIENLPRGGRWLDVCAGDGRFSARLLAKADEVVAFDIDPNALSKLERITPAHLRSKLTLRTGNVTERFPFDGDSFDGVFCTGTLHLFPTSVLHRITSEMDRVLKPGGRVILDYATDIRRELPDGSLYVVEGEPNSTLQQGDDLLRRCFPDYQVNVTTAAVEPEDVVTPKHRWRFSSNMVLLVGTKVCGVQEKS